MLVNRIKNLCSNLIGAFAGVAPYDRGGLCASAPRLAAAVRPVSECLRFSMKQLWTALILACLVPFQSLAATNGDLIINKAQLNSRENPPIKSTVTVTVRTRTPSTTEFLKYASGNPNAVGTTVKTTYYQNSSGAFIAIDQPVVPGTGAPIDLSVAVPLIKSALFHAGEPIFIRLTDLDQNLDPNVAETVLVTVSDPKTGDSEAVKLTESGTNSGIFIGYILTTSAAATSTNNSGILHVSEANPINARYVDIVDGTDSSADAALVDPFGIVFDTRTGKPVDGATIELLNADGTAAAVFGDNGLATNTYPSSIISGSTATDRELNTYSFPPGGYRFPFVNPGNYILKITPPTGYISPSVVPINIIQALPGAPFTILEPGSRGEIFTVPAGPAIRVDIPLDPKIGSFWLSKRAGKNLVSAGEYLGYELNLENKDTEGTVFSPVLIDKLPHGFRYQKGSALVNGTTVPDPAVSSDGVTMTFTLADIPAATSVSIRYTAAIGAGAQTGAAINTAVATAANSVRSNVAKATVQVQEPFMKSRNIIMGRVVVGACSENAEDMKKGMGGVGIYLEDGTFVISDKLGMFHFEGVRSGTHVVQLDLDSIPEGYKILPCEQNSRFAGRAYSQFVDMQGGTMWRTDFYLGRTELTPPPAEVSEGKHASTGKGTEAEATLLSGAAGKKSEAGASASYTGEISLELISSQSGNFIDYRIPLQSATVPLTNLNLSVHLPYGAIYVKGSSTFDSSPFADPEVAANVISYHLGSAGADWQKELRFRVVIGRQAPAGELQTKAVLTFVSPDGKNIAVPAVDNLLTLVKEENHFDLPAIVVRPQFPTFGAELSDSDRKNLDELALMLGRFKIDKIEVGGHTDNVRIAPRSRNVYADNTALSYVRARSVGRYLVAALHLTPEMLYLSGSGEKSPLANNKTDAGRAINRRVEVKVSAANIVESAHLKITKERSGVQKQETIGISVKPSAINPSPLAPPQLKKESFEMLSAQNSVAGSPAEETVQTTASTKQSAVEKQAVPKKQSATSSISEKKKEHVELFSALSEGIVHYRIKLVGAKESLRSVTATIVTPKSQLYMTGTSRLSGLPAADPETKESVITYTISTFPDDKKFDLRLQALIDGDDQLESLNSSITFTINDADGKVLRTYAATAGLSDNMEEINRPDIPAAQDLVNQDGKEKAEAEIINAYVESVPGRINSGKTDSPGADAGLHVTDNEGILSPADGTIIASQVNAVRIVLKSGLTPLLTLDGKEIPSERIGFSMKDNKSEKSLYTYIGVDFGSAGEHILQLKGMDTFNVVRFDKSAKVTRTGEITTLKLVSAEGNIADGRTPVRVRIQLFDKDDNPVQANAELALKGGDLRPLSASGNIGRDTGAATVSVDGQGWISFQPVNSSGLYRAQISYNKAVLDIETYVKPKMRDWILVGLAEGTAGYNTISGNMESLQASGNNENFYDKERLAFFAKGTIKGEWLLTAAYDSAKQRTGVTGNGLFQTIDPNTYYTLYGDGSSQMYDAASQSKLYLKIERDQFYAMFGDYDSGLTVTELSRYSRRMNGIKSEYRSKDYDVTVFGSETAQSFIKEEIRGDGTSGLYRLERSGIVINSEKISIETHDRFHSEIITNSVPLSRFIDYSIDYDTGAILFKSPVANRDENLNPVYIVVAYEILNAGTDALTYGGRAAVKLLDAKLQVGGTYVHEGQVSGDNTLYGVDASAVLAPGTTAKAEFATTNSDSAVKTSGNAYLAEVTHTGKQLDGKVYFREQQNGFGLGQQNATESGTRKYGADVGYKLNEKLKQTSQGYRQYNLADGAVRDYIDMLTTYNEKQYSVRGGIRYANDTQANGTNATSVLGTAGGSWRTADQKVTLRADHDQALFKNNNTDFPTRTVLGIDYQATKDTALFAQQELTYGESANTNTTRAGVKSTPWSGGSVNSSVVNDMRENDERTFANVGLTQKIKLNQSWTADGGLERSQTIRKKTGYTLNAAVPPASGGEDFTAVSLGANYTEKKLAWSNRVEFRTSSIDDKWGVMSGVINEQGVNWGWTTRLQLFHTQSVGGNSSTNADVRFGLAYRPPVTKWIILNRIDLLVSDVKSGTSSTQGKRLVNNLSVNYRPNKKTQLSILYSAKYVLETIDAKKYRGYTDMIGFEGRYDITRKWDVGLRAMLLHSWRTNQYSYSFGPSVGYNVMENAWISVGYNLAGFTDKAFSDANYTAQGPFIQYRFKFDQNSVKEGLKMMGQ